MRALLAFLLGIGLTGSAGESSLSVGAYYYPWYHDDGRHWSQGYEGVSKDLKPAEPPKRRLTRLEMLRLEKAKAAAAADGGE